MAEDDLRLSVARGSENRHVCVSERCWEMIAADHQICRAVSPPHSLWKALGVFHSWSVVSEIFHHCGCG